MPRTTLLGCSAFAWLMAFCVCAQANTPVWRCETGAGAAVAYQATPCQDGGQALPMNTPPTAEDRDASARVAEREASLARAMGQQRAKREKNLPPAHASLTGPVRQVSVGQREEDRIKAADRRSSRARQRRHDVFRAEAPGRPRNRSSQHQADAASAAPP
jgi:hypothetical protein